MNSNDYVLNHNFGYDNDDCEKINKIELRNIEDLKVYVKLNIQTLLFANLKDNVVTFFDDFSKEKYFIEEIE